MTAPLDRADGSADRECRMMTPAPDATPAPTPLVSASQVTLYRECSRKWAWKYIAKIEPPQSAAAALGDEIDSEQLQPYLTEGRSFDFTRESGYIAAAGLAYLPAPKHPGLEVQKHFVLPAATARNPDGSARFGYQGYLDLWLPSGGAPDLPPAPASLVVPVVQDFKSTGDLRWAKKESALAVDVQANLYATWAMYETGARVVDLVWLYFQTRGVKKVKRTHLRVHADQVEEQFVAIDRTAVEMLDVRDSITDPESAPLALPPNVEMCEQYGGCPYRSRCNLSPAQVVDSFAAKAAALTGTTRKELTMSSPGDLFAKLQAKRAAFAAAAPAPSTPQPVAATAVRPPITEEPPLPPTALGINPPESLLPPVPPVGTATIASPPQAEPAAAATVEGAATKRALGRSRKSATASETEDASETITVTWGEETFSPVQYNSFRVGPFSATARVLPGESRSDALRRISAELYAFATEERANKAEAFKRALGR